MKEILLPVSTLYTQTLYNFNIPKKYFDKDFHLAIKCLRISHADNVNKYTDGYLHFPYAGKLKLNFRETDWFDHKEYTDENEMRIDSLQVFSLWSLYKMLKIGQNFFSFEID